MIRAIKCERKRRNSFIFRTLDESQLCWHSSARISPWPGNQIKINPLNQKNNDKRNQKPWIGKENSPSGDIRADGYHRPFLRSWRPSLHQPLDNTLKPILKPNQTNQPPRPKGTGVAEARAARPKPPNRGESRTRARPTLSEKKANKTNKQTNKQTNVN